ncbi:MAG: PHP domain-containing protein [Candidatus Omnitrophota bacterium]
MKFADLHLHTNFSDGTYTPQELIAASLRAGLSAIAITDHDTVDGISLAEAAAEKENIELLPGIELTVEHNGIEIHLLGYLIDYKSAGLLEKLKTLKQIRIKRVYKITDKLKDMGLALDPESVFAIAGEGTVGRLHIARAMLKQKLVGSIYDAFKTYIGDKCPAYVLGFRLSPREAIQVIKDAGGIPVLAHPYLMKNDELISEFSGFGLMGLEVYYPEHSQGMVNHYLDIAKKYNLLATGGSDYHGEVKPGVRIGSAKVSYELVEKLKQAKV